MAMNLYNLSLNAYSAFLEYSGLLGNRISAACISFSGDSKSDALKEVESKGLIINDKLSDEGNIIANIISTRPATTPWRALYETPRTWV